MLVDSHCHLNFKDFEEDVDQVVERAGEAGIGAMVTICTHMGEADEVAEVAARYRNVFCTVGVHPHEAASAQDLSADELVERTAGPKVVGIGETGLDFFYDNSPRAEQAKSFRTHIAAARETGLPLVVHSRDADDEMAAILEDEMGKGAFTGVMHCFSSGAALADKALALGFYISISGIVTFKKADDLRAIVKEVPLDRLLVETDAPFLAPVPHRGKRNEPGFVRHTADAVAELKSVSVAALEEATTDNFLRLFSRVPEAAVRPS